MQEINRQCNCCRGTGTIPVSDMLAETWRELAKYDETTGAKLCRVLGCQATAMNQRLRTLEGFGLATSRRNGRQRFYRVLKQEAT